MRKNNTVFISAILLAAGESRRMGSPKLLLPFGDSTILEQVVDNLLNSKVDELIVVVGYRAEELVRKMTNRPVKLALNPNYQHGMSTSIIAGLNLIDKRSKAIMVALADQPLVDSKIINKLMEEFRRHDKGIVVPVHQGKRGHPVIFSIRYKEELLTLRGDIGGREINNKYPHDILEVAIGSQYINLDVDTLNDYKRLSNQAVRIRRNHQTPTQSSTSRGYNEKIWSSP